jgi:hypothetical protein
MFTDSKVRNITLVQFLGIAFAFIFFIASCVVASYDCGLAAGCSNDAIKIVGVTNGEGFMIVGFALAFLTFLGTGIFFMNKRLGKVVYGFYTAATSYMILASLAMAVWAGGKLGTLQSQVDGGGLVLKLGEHLPGSLKAMIAGASLLLVALVGKLVLLIMGKAALTEEAHSELAADPNAAYSASYQNYEVPAGTANPYQQDGAAI